MIRIAVFAVLLSATSAYAASVQGADASKLQAFDHPRRIPGRYIVFLDESHMTAKRLSKMSTRPGMPDARTLRAEAMSIRTETETVADDLLRGHRHSLVQKLGVVSPGVIIETEEEEARKIALDPRVKVVMADYELPSVITTEQSPAPSWGLDRLDQTSLPLDNRYVYNGTGNGINVYIMDSGIRTTHQDFGGRATIDAVMISDANPGGDCNGHGTRVASIVGGSKYGVAKLARLRGVRNVNCNGGSTAAAVIASLDWLERNGLEDSILVISQVWRDDCPPATQNYSDAFCVNSTNALNEVTYYRNMQVVIASGNNGATTNIYKFRPQTCSSSPYSPSNWRYGECVLVGATTSTDSFWSGGNRFPSVDIYAPGGSITTAVNSSDTASGVESGTSLAAPHVAGVLAIIKQHYPEYLRNERLTKLYTLSSWAPGISQYIVGNGGAAGPPGNGQVPPGTGPYFPGNSLLPAVIFPLLLQ